MSNQNTQEEIPVACDLCVFTDEDQQKHKADSAALFAKVTEVQELAGGYALRLSDGEGILSLMADFIDDESRCCPFFHFSLEVEPGRKAIWLKLTGSEVVKEFLSTEIAPLLLDTVAKRVGLQ